MNPYLVLFLISFGLSLLFTALLIYLVRSQRARKGHLFQKAAGRKRNVIPGLGGIAIYLTVWLVCALSFLLAPNFTSSYKTYIFGLFVATTLVLLLGIWDDFRKLDYRIKFPIQILAAFVLYAYGFRIETVTDPFRMSSITLGVWSLPLSIFWHLLVINAINLIDGLDGLASGITAIALGVLLTVSQYEYSLTNFISIILFAAVLGFLPYNFFPARIFLGDTGSELLGLFLSSITLLSAMKSTVAIALTIPFAVLIIPNINAILIALVRLGRMRNPFRSQTGFHLHYKLIRIGYTHRETVLLLYFASLLFGSISFWAVQRSNPAFSFWLTGTSILFMVSIYFGIDRIKKL